MSRPEELRIFIASPGDVQKERKAVYKIIKNLNEGLCCHLNIRLKPFLWENNARPGIGRPQDVIFNQFSPKEWDIFIGILWSKFGSESGYEENGHRYTGTEEEFKRAYEEWEKSKNIEIMIYKSTKPIQYNDIDSKQIEAVKNFFSEFNPKGKHPGLFREYSTMSMFEKAIFSDLCETIIKIVKKRSIIKNYDEDIKKVLELYDYDSLIRLREIGLEQCTKTLKNTDLEPMRCMKKTRKQLYFSGICGNKWIGNKKGFKEFQNMLHRVADNNGQVRFLLINPKSETFIKMIAQQGGDNHNDVFYKWKQLVVENPCLSVRCFNELPSFRMQFMDDQKMALTKYHYQKDEYEKYNKGWNSPHLIINSNAPFSFYNVFEKNYLNEWDNSIDITKII